MVAIRAAAWYHPDHQIDVADLPELSALTEAERENCLGLGIKGIRADDELGAFELMARASRRALADAELEPQDIGALIVVESRAQETLMASEATRLQALLGLRDAITVSVGGLGCVSITPALLTARGLLAADEELRHVLVAHGSKPATPSRYRHPVTVSGDCGQALILSRTGPVRVLDILQETNGAYWDLFQVAYRNRPTEQWREECSDPHTYAFRLAVETRNRLRGLHHRLLDRNDLEGRGHYFSQNLSDGSFRFCEEALGIELHETCRQNLRRYGHLGPNDVFLNYFTAAEQDGRHAVLLNISPVAAWSAVLLGPGDGGDTHYL
jgi:3-oxoacyl-[acyl-carrier-protein] synthase-3